MSVAHDMPVDVLVVGAGPVGLFAALCAVKRGLKTRVIDQNWRGHSRGYASILHASSLELLSRVGLGERVSALGQRIERIGLYVDGSRAESLALPSPARALAQSALEDLLLVALRAEGVDIDTPFQATTIEQTPEVVRVGIVRREQVAVGEWEPVHAATVSAKFVIGADGYDSRVRSASGIETVEVGATETYAMFEVTSSRAPHSELELAIADGLASVVFCLTTGRVRAGFRVASALHEAADLERLRGLLAERAAWRDDSVQALDWGVVTHFERRLARSFGKARVWLVGDAAHVAPPFGGHSVNGGFTEARRLIDTVGAILAGKRSVDALQREGSAWQREWHKLLGINVHVDLLPHARAWLRPYARDLVPNLPASGHDLEALLAELGLALR